VHRDLRIHTLRKQFALVERNAGFVAGSLDPKDQHEVDSDTIQPLSEA
jgi:hypothetical protein